jgi:hypothetical protein
MKITKEGKDLGTLDFVCEDCGTEFSAERGEYTQRIGETREDLGWKMFGCFETGVMKRKITPCYIATAICPSCEAEIDIYIPKGESYTKDVNCSGGW